MALVSVLENDSFKNYLFHDKYSKLMLYVILVLFLVKNIIKIFLFLVLVL